MPIVVKDFTWQETDKHIFITVPLKGVKSEKLDILTTEEYIKVRSCIIAQASLATCHLKEQQLFLTINRERILAYFLQVHFVPYLCELFLFRPVLDESSRVEVGNGVALFKCEKKEPEKWEQLQHPEAGSQRLKL